jgi:hypothetical protein
MRTHRPQREGLHGGGGLLVCRCRETLNGSIQSSDRAIDGLTDYRRAGGGRQSQRREPVAQRGNRRFIQQAVPVQLGLGKHEDWYVTQIACAKHLSQVWADLLGGSRRHLVEHERHRGGTAARDEQQLPRHRVGIPGR